MQRRSQFDASPDDLAFLQRDDWRDDLDLRFRTRTHADQFLEHPVIFRSAIRVAGAIFRHCSDVNRSRANRFRPAHRHRKKVRIPKSNIRYGNRAAMRASSLTVFLFSASSASLRYFFTFPVPFFYASSNSLGRRIPNKFVQLQPQPYRQTVGKNPFHEHARLEPRPLSLRVFKHRRKQDLSYSSRQAMLQGKIAREFVVAASG